MSSLSDSEDISIDQEADNRLQAQLQNYQNENHQLKKENLNLQTQITNLQTNYESKIQLMEIKNKQSLEELQNRIKIATNAQNEQQRKFVQQQQQQTLSMHSQIQDMQDKISAISAEKDKLSQQISKSELELKREKSYYENKISVLNQQNAQIYSKATIYFGKTVSSPETLMDCFDLKNKNQCEEKYKNQISAEALRAISKLKCKVQDLREALKLELIKSDEQMRKIRDYKEQIKNIESEREKKEQKYKNEICELSQNVKCLEMKLCSQQDIIKSASSIIQQHNSNYSANSAMKQNHVVSLNQSNAIQSKTGCQNILGNDQKEYVIKTFDSELQDDLLKQINKLNKKLIKKEKKIQALISVVRDNDLTIQELQATKENQELEIEHSRTRAENLENQLRDAINQIQNVKETNEVCQMKEIKNRKLKRQKIVIEDQNAEIERLTKENKRLNEIATANKVTIQRLETELSLCNKIELEERQKSEQTKQQNDKQKGNITIDECETEPSIDWELCDDLPYEVEIKIKEITRNDSLSLPSKLRMVLECLIKYYTNKINSNATANSEVQKKLKKIEFSLQPFIEEVTEVTLGRKVSFDALTESPETQAAVIKTIASKMRSPLEMDSLQTRLVAAQNEIQDLKKKLLKRKATVNVIENNANDMVVNTDIQRLSRENAELRRLLDEQRETANDRIKDAKFGLINEYETVINQLKERCAKQKKTIDELMAQLSGASLLSSSL